MTKENVAFEERYGNNHCVAFSEVEFEYNKAWIKIPKRLAELDYLGIEEDNVEMYWNEDGYISIGSYTGEGICKVEVKKEDGEYWIRLTNQMSTLKPLNNETHFPVLFLSCGELWVVNNQHLWEKLPSAV